jgi:preprotein translocase SecE subunit
MLNSMNALIMSILAEIAKVSWPSRQETIKLTLIVIVVSVSVGLYIGFLDVAFAKGLQLTTK